MFGNTVTIIGNLTRDPELRHTPSGTPLASLGVAWNRRYEQNGKEIEDVSFFNITCWGSLGENICSSNLQSGSRVIVVGRLDQRSWENQQGEKRSVVEIIADEVSPSLKWASVEVTKNQFKGGGGGYSSRGSTNYGDSQVGNTTNYGGSQTEGSRGGASIGDSAGVSTSGSVGSDSRENDTGTNTGPNTGPNTGEEPF